MNEVTYFDFKSRAVRVVFNTSGEPLFCLADIGHALEIPRSSDLLQVERGDVKNETPKKRGALNPKGVHSLKTQTTSGIQKLTFISEENLYRIVFRSTKPEAINFQNWVFAEVLPTIRKTGSYTARHTAYEELNRLCMQAKTQKAKGSFHGTGLVTHRYAMRDLNLRITTCKNNIQLPLQGFNDE